MTNDSKRIGKWDLYIRLRSQQGIAEETPADEEKTETEKETKTEKEKETTAKGTDKTKNETTPEKISQTGSFTAVTYITIAGVAVLTLAIAATRIKKYNF